MNSFDHFVKRELRCRAYLRYVDDMALFSAALECHLTTWNSHPVKIGQTILGQPNASTRITDEMQGITGAHPLGVA